MAVPVRKCPHGLPAPDTPARPRSRGARLRSGSRWAGVRRLDLRLSGHWCRRGLAFPSSQEPQTLWTHHKREEHAHYDETEGQPLPILRELLKQIQSVAVARDENANALLDDAHIRESDSGDAWPDGARKRTRSLWATSSSSERC